MRTYKTYFLFIAYVVCSLTLCCVIAQWLCTIHSGECYGWLSGVWHGICFIPNLVLSLFGDRLLKADTYTTAYNIWWWIFTIVSWVSMLSSYVYAFVFIRSFSKVG